MYSDKQFNRYYLHLGISAKGKWCLSKSSLASEHLSYILLSTAMKVARRHKTVGIWNKIIFTIKLNCIWKRKKLVCHSHDFSLTLHYNRRIFSSPSYYVWRTLVIMQIFDFRLLAELRVLGSEEYKKHKISMVSGYSLVS